MKRILPVFIMLFVLSLLVGCADSDGSGVVQLDGPIMEGINRDGNLEFNGAVVNTGEEPVKSVVVVIILKDEQGRIVEALSVPVSGDSPDEVISPMERAFFTVTASVDPTSIFSREVEIFFEGGDSSVDEGRDGG